MSDRWMTLSPDGVLEEHDGVPTLKQLQDAVGGDVQAVVALGVTVWMREDAKIVENPPRFNPKASVLCAGALRLADFVVGTVALTGLTSRSGATTGLSAATAERLRNFLGSIKTRRAGDA